MNDGIEQKRLAILRILQNSKKPVSSQEIAENLKTIGYDISERTIRFHLQLMDKEKLTNYVNKQGREITEIGLIELSKARIVERVGYLNAKIDRLTYLMDFDPVNLTGKVIINISLVEAKHLKQHYKFFLKVFESGYAMGNLMTLFYPGEMMNDMPIPENFIGIGTVCSITLNGILLSYGIPSYSRFGGLLELKNHKPTRFVAIINYDGTTIDPLELFIRSGMTDYIGATDSGNGIIGVGFREMPQESRDKVMEINEHLTKIGLGGLLEIGLPGQPVMEIPVHEGRIGVIVIGGLNPVAILEERGIKLYSRALSGFVDFGKLFHYKELADKIKEF